MAKMPYSTEKDFAPVSMIVRSPNVLVVRADSPFNPGRVGQPARLFNRT